MAVEPASTFDESVVVERLRQGDRLAAELVMRRHNRALWRIARGILRDDADAEEAVQDAYLRAFTRIGEFRGEASLGTWLGRIAVNEALRRLERQRAISDFLTTPPDVQHQIPNADPAQTPEHLAARREIRRMVERAVDRLPAPFRMVFILRTMEQRSIQETADTLGIPAATVKTRLHRAIQLLRQALGEELAAALEGAFPFDGMRCDRLTLSVLRRLCGLPGIDRGNLSSPPRSNDRKATLMPQTTAWPHQRSPKMRAAVIAISACLLAVPAIAQKVEHAPPGGPYKKVSELVKLPDFLPGLGTLYVNPSTLPAGPFLAYDHQGKLVSTIYMIPLKDITEQKTFDDLSAPGGHVDHVSLYFNAGHPGVPDPHYHIVLWHVSKQQEALVAK